TIMALSGYFTFSFPAPRDYRDLHPFPTRRSSDLVPPAAAMPLRFCSDEPTPITNVRIFGVIATPDAAIMLMSDSVVSHSLGSPRSEEHTSELQSRGHLVCRLLLGKKNTSTESTQN